mgnify:CR=1 FL=1
MNAGTLMEPVGPSIGEGNSTYFELLKGLAGCYREPTGVLNLLEESSTELHGKFQYNYCRRS